MFPTRILDVFAEASLLFFPSPTEFRRINLRPARYVQFYERMILIFRDGYFRDMRPPGRSLLEGSCKLGFFSLSSAERLRFPGTRDRDVFSVIGRLSITSSLLT